MAEKKEKSFSYFKLGAVISISVFLGCYFAMYAWFELPRPLIETVRKTFP